MPYLAKDGTQYVGDRQPGDIEVAEWSIDRGVPQVVTRFQARAALLNTPSMNPAFSNMLAEVDDAMRHPDTDGMAQLAWTDAQEFYRQSPTILAVAPMLGLSSDDLDQLFIAAAGMQA